MNELTTKVNTSSYTLVAEARGQTVLFFRRFGDYQGEWLLFAKDNSQYYIYRDSYGSCSGCDPLEAANFDYDWESSAPGNYSANDPKVQEFIADYEPFLVMSRDAALSLAMREDSLLAVTPANRREWLDESMPMTRIGHEFASIVRADHGVARPQDIIRLSNLEQRRAALEQYGETRFVENLNPTVLDKNCDNFLMESAIEGESETYKFLYLQDSSTPRRYVLRVPPEVTKVREAIAWTFDMTADEYAPTVET